MDGIDLNATPTDPTEADAPPATEANSIFPPEPKVGAKPHPGPASSWAMLRRRGWLLWGVTLVLVLALTATVPVLDWALHGTVDDRAALSSDEFIAIVGLSGLVLVFCLYSLLKQRELEEMRDALAREERDKDGIRARLSELSALFQVSTTLNLQLRLDTILEIIVRRVVATLRAQQASVMIVDPANGVLETRASYGLESEFARHGRKKLGEGISGWVAERQEAVLLNAEGGPGNFVRYFKRNRNITSALSLPLTVGDRCVGVLNVNRINHPEPFQEHHRETLKLFAEHVGTVIERAETLDRLGRRNRELEAVNQQLSEASRLKDVFLSTASHELRTPLTSVIAYAELLSEHEHRIDSSQRADFLTRLRGEAQRLLGLIEEILDLGRIETGKLVLKRVPLDLRAVLRDAYQTTGSTAERYRVTLVLEPGAPLPAVPVDEVKMRQSVVNLLVNAIKFSPEGGTVKLGARLDEGSVRIEVNDQGPGIGPEDSVHIFQLFGQGVRLQGSDRGGLGIGLHLVKRLVELHGGHVGVNSTAGSGSTFWIRLPLPATESDARSEEGRAAA